MTANLSDLAPLLTDQQRRGLLDELSVTYQGNVEAAARGTANMLTQQWILPGLAGILTAWDTTYVTVVGAGQIETYEMTAAYTAQYVSLVIGSPLMPIISPQRDWLVNSESFGTRSGPARLAKLLADGIPYEQALERAGRYMAGVAMRDVQTGMRMAGEDWAARSGIPTRWRKSVSFASCGWCQKVGGERTYREAMSVPAHDGDRCGIAPVVEGDGWTPQPVSAERAATPAPVEAATLPQTPTVGDSTP